MELRPQFKKILQSHKTTHIKENCNLTWCRYKSIAYLEYAGIARITDIIKVAVYTNTNIIDFMETWIRESGHHLATQDIKIYTLPSPEQYLIKCAEAFLNITKISPTTLYNLITKCSQTHNTLALENLVAGFGIESFGDEPTLMLAINKFRNALKAYIKHCKKRSLRDGGG